MLPSLCIAGNGKPDVCSRNKETPTMPLEHTGARCVRFSRYDPSCQPATGLHKLHSVRRWGRSTSSWWICFYNVDIHCRTRCRSLRTWLKRVTRWSYSRRPSYGTIFATIAWIQLYLKLPSLTLWPRQPLSYIRSFYRIEQNYWSTCQLG